MLEFMKKKLGNIKFNEFIKSMDKNKIKDVGIKRNKNKIIKNKVIEKIKINKNEKNQNNIVNKKIEKDKNNNINKKV